MGFRLTLVVLFVVACSRPSSAPAGVDASLQDAVAAGVADAMTGAPMCGDEPCPDPGIVVNPFVKAKLDSRTPQQIAAAACRRADGSWACKGVSQPMMAGNGNSTAAQCGPACTIGAWWFDPANGTGCASDTNSGTSATCGANGIGPLLTFAQLITRLGSTMPQYPAGQGVSVTQLSAQAANTDFIFFEPRLSSTTTNQAAAIFTVTPVAVGAPQTITVSTAKVRGAPGTLLTLTNPTGVAINQLMVNTTKSSQAIVDSVAGTTVMQQPLTTASVTATNVAPVGVSDDTWATGNTVQLYALQNSNLVRWRPVGGNFTSGNAPTGGWVFTAAIADTSGSGASEYAHQVTSGVNVLSNCVINTRLHMGGLEGRGFGLYVIGSSIVGGVLVTGVNPVMYGGGFAAGFNVIGGGESLQNDTIVHSFMTTSNGYVNIASTSAYADGTWTAQGSYITPIGFFWGSYSMTVSPGSVFWNQTGSTFVLKALLTTGTIKLGTATTGQTSPTPVSTFTCNGASQVSVAGALGPPNTNFPANAPITWSLANANGGTIGATGPAFSQATSASNFFVKCLALDTSIYSWSAGPASGVTLTPANIDLYNGLSDPNTGARFANPN